MSVPAIQGVYSNPSLDVEIKYIPKVYDFFDDNQDAEILVIGGGRGKGATWGIGNELIADSMADEHFIWCTRQMKNSIDHSSRRTIELLIKQAGLENYFIFQNQETICKITGSRFIYNGLSERTEDSVQGVEGITRGWLAEAHTTALSTWQKYEPTVRDNRAKIFIDYNIQYANTPIHTLFVENPTIWPFEGKKDMPELAYLFMDYRDNIYCPEKTLKSCARNKKQYAIQDWEWIWLGKLKDSSDRYVCDEVEVRKAMKREVDFDDEDTIICGCDIAHMGGDEIVFYKRRGYKFLDNGRKMTKKRFPIICDELEAYINYNKGAILVIDNGHIGAAVADEMNKRGYYVERINFGGTKEMHFDPKHCKNCATDMAFNFLDMLPKLQLPNDQVMCNQVSQRMWDFVTNKYGVRIIEGKDKFKTHAVNLEGHKSPDRGDAIWLACYNKNKVRTPQGVGGMFTVWR